MGDGPNEFHQRTISGNQILELSIEGWPEKRRTDHQKYWGGSLLCGRLEKPEAAFQRGSPRSRALFPAGRGDWRRGGFRKMANNGVARSHVACAMSGTHHSSHKKNVAFGRVECELLSSRDPLTWTIKWISNRPESLCRPRITMREGISHAPTSRTPNRNRPFMLEPKSDGLCVTEDRVRNKCECIRLGIPMSMAFPTET